MTDKLTEVIESALGGMDSTFVDGGEQYWPRVVRTVADAVRERYIDDLAASQRADNAEARAGQLETELTEAKRMRHGDPAMFGAVYGFELGEAEGQRERVRLRSLADVLRKSRQMWRDRADEAEAKLSAIRELATEWARQATDYDEDTEQQIEDGRKVLAILFGEDAKSGKPTAFQQLAVLLEGLPQPVNWSWHDWESVVVLTRVVCDNGVRHSLEEVAAEFGIDLEENGDG